MNGIEIITIGGEILSGRTPDANFLYLARGLHARGLVCRWHTSVADDGETLSAVLRTALGRARVIVTTGGLGSTSDDITRKVLSRVLDRQLVLREDVLARIEERYARAGRPAPPNLAAQALLPFGTEAIPNPIGSAPGITIETKDQRTLFALPGVPREMERMAERFVLPDIESRFPQDKLEERLLRVSMIPESALAERIGGMIPPEVEIAYLPEAGTVDLRLSSRSGLPVGGSSLDRLSDAIAEKVGTAVYARREERIESVVGRFLVSRGWSLAVAESLTGGAIGKRIVRVPGASRYFLGDIVAYDNRAKQSLLGVPESWIHDHGAVSRPVAEAMAHGVRERFGSDVGLSTTGIAGPEGGTPEKPVGLVWFALVWPGGRVAIEQRMVGERIDLIERSVTFALDMVRRATLDAPIQPGEP